MITKAEQLTEDLFAIKIAAENHLTDVEYEDLELSIAELRRLAPMEARIKELEGALSLIASCEVKFDGDVVSIARKALGEKP